MRTCFSINWKLKRVRQAGSRRIKVAIRKLGKQELTEGEVLAEVKLLQQQIKNKER